LRKSFLVAGTATLALGMAGIAYAQNPAPSIESTASVSPTKAGTKSKPKAETLKLSVKNNAESKTTAAKITITFPSTLKISTKGLDQCKLSDEELIASPGKCSKAKAGSGNARALLGAATPNPGPLSFKVVPYVGKNELLFLLSGSADAVLHGKISGKKMSIIITPQLQQPVPNTYSALNDLATTISKKKGKNSLITSTGCKSKKHTIGVSISYVPNPTPPAATSASKPADAKCS
jgi:hypothetical protein